MECDFSLVGHLLGCCRSLTDFQSSYNVILACTWVIIQEFAGKVLQFLRKSRKLLLTSSGCSAKVSHSGSSLESCYKPHIIWGSWMQTASRERWPLFLLADPTSVLLTGSNPGMGKGVLGNVVPAAWESWEGDHGGAELAAHSHSIALAQPEPLHIVTGANYLMETNV